MILRELFESATNGVAIIFGRFNPPHFGHVSAWQVAAGFPAWYVGTNQSTQGPKDPLPYDIKIEAMKKLYPKLNGHLVPEQSWFTLASMVYKKHGEVTLYIVTDSTDVKIYLPMIQKHNGIEGPHGYYKFKSIEWAEAKRQSEASLVRKAVKENNPKDFEKHSGVSANTIVSGHPYFDLVRHYMLPYMQAEEEKERTAAEKAKIKAEKEAAKKPKTTNEGFSKKFISNHQMDPTTYDMTTNVNVADHRNSNLMIQLAKNIDLHGGYPIEFKDGSVLHVSSQLSQKILFRLTDMLPKEKHIMVNQLIQSKEKFKAFVNGTTESLIDPGPEANRRSKEIKDLIRQEIDTLSPKQQYVVDKFYFQNMTVGEIAKESGYTTGYISQVLAFSLGKLRGNGNKYKSKILKSIDKTEFGLLESKKKVNENRDLGSPFKKGTGNPIYSYDTDAMRRATGTMEDSELDEVADQPYRYMLTKKLPGGRQYMFQTDSGTKFQVFFSLLDTGTDKIADVGFADQTDKDNPTIAMTGKGDAFRVFATVGAIVKEYVNSVKPDFLSFSGKTQDPGRIKLYDMIAKNIKRYLTDYEQSSHTMPGASDEKGYMLQRITKPVDEVAKVKISTDPNDFGAYVRDGGKDEPTVMLPIKKINQVLEPDDLHQTKPGAPERIKNMVIAIRQGKSLPPILVRRHKLGYQVLDGHHRFKAYKIAKATKIPARIVDPKNVTGDTTEDAAGVGIITKQNSTADVGPGTIKRSLRAFKL